MGGHFRFPGNGYHGPKSVNPVSAVPAAVDHLALCRTCLQPPAARTNSRLQKIEVVAGLRNRRRSTAGAHDRRVARQSQSHRVPSAPFHYGSSVPAARGFLHKRELRASACRWQTMRELRCSYTCAGPRKRGRRHGRGDGRNLRPTATDHRRTRCAEHRPSQFQGAAELRGGRVPAGARTACRLRVSRWSMSCVARPATSQTPATIFASVLVSGPSYHTVVAMPGIESPHARKRGLGSRLHHEKPTTDA